MAVFRVEKDSNYTVMSNFHFKERKMSLKAKGLLSLMLSLPDTWDYSIGGLVTLCSEGEKAIKSALQELRNFGYLEMNRRHIDGRYDWEYVIYESPKTVTTTPLQDDCNENTITPLQEGCNEPVEKEPVENGVIYKDTKKLNTNKSNTKRKYLYFGEYQNAFFTEEQYQKLISEFPNDYEERIDRLDSYIQSTGKKYKDCLATIRNWAKKEVKTNKKNSGWNYLDEEFKKIQERNDIF